MCPSMSVELSSLEIVLRAVLPGFLRHFAFLLTNFNFLYVSDEVRSAMGGRAPGTIQLKTSEQIRPHTGAGTFQSTQHSSHSGVGFHKRTQSVKRHSRNTLNAHTTLDSAMTIDKSAADPRYNMYNKEMIKGALEKRRARRAQSNIRPR